MNTLAVKRSRRQARLVKWNMVDLRTRFYGPYVGEFGHEIANVGVVRKTARGYEYVIVCSRAANEALYTDFADEFVAHDIDCCGRCEGTTPETRPSRWVLNTWTPLGSHVTPLAPMPMDTRNGANMVRNDAEHIVYGTVKPEYAGAIVIHARWRPYVPARNWPLAQWHRLTRWLFSEGHCDRVICIGTPEHALTVEGALDMRHAPLSEQMDVLRSARCAIGPSSGPMHLASMCKCPHLVWCGGESGERTKTAGLYRHGWNPHGTFARAFECANWQPSFEVVVEHARAFLSEVAA